MVDASALKARVAAGAAYLDEVRPGWHDAVNVERLSMDHPEDCVIGQVFGDYDDYVNAQGIGRDLAEGLGLFSQYQGDTADWLNSYAILTDLWREVITGRQGADAALAAVPVS